MLCKTPLYRARSILPLSLCVCAFVYVCVWLQLFACFCFVSHCPVLLSAPTPHSFDDMKIMTSFLIRVQISSSSFVLTGCPSHIPKPRHHLTLVCPPPLSFTSCQPRIRPSLKPPCSLFKRTSKLRQRMKQASNPITVAPQLQPLPCRCSSAWTLCRNCTPLQLAAVISPARTSTKQLEISTAVYHSCS